MLLASGTTTVADIESVPELIGDLPASTPLRVFSFLEMTNVRSRRTADEILLETVSAIESSPRKRGGYGLSPHALYLTSPDLMRAAGGGWRRRNWVLTTHAAESEQEFEMYRHGRGPLYDWLKPQRDVSDCGGESPVRHLDSLGVLGRNCLAVHVNYLDLGDAALLSERQTSVV